MKDTLNLKYDGTLHVATYKAGRRQLENTEMLWSDFAKG